MPCASQKCYQHLPCRLWSWTSSQECGLFHTTDTAFDGGVKWWTHIIYITSDDAAEELWAWKEVVDGTLGCTEHSPKVPGPQRNSECIPLLHNTVTSEGSHSDKKPCLVHREAALFHTTCPIEYTATPGTVSLEMYSTSITHPRYCTLHYFRPLRKDFKGKHFWCDDKVKAKVQ